MNTVWVPAHKRKGVKGKVKGHYRKKRPKGKRRKIDKRTYKHKVLRDEFGRVIGTRRVK